MNSAATLAALEGTWVPSYAALSGQPLDLREMRVACLVVERAGYRIIDKLGAVVDSGVLDAPAGDGRNSDDPQLRGAELLSVDLVGVVGPYAGRRLLALCRLQGDQLLICHDLERGERPRSLQAVGEQLLLSITYVRRGASQPLC